MPQTKPSGSDQSRTSMDERALHKMWNQAIPYVEFLEEANANEQLWRGVYQRAQIPDWALDLACSKAGDTRLLVIAEDWCGDASNTVPILAKLGDEAACLELRIVKRDEHPEFMERYLTNGTRSIPIVVALDDRYRELGYWGPRPTELQDWVMANKETLPKSELYPQVRRWYAKDRGETTLREVLALL